MVDSKIHIGVIDDDRDWLKTMQGLYVIYPDVSLEIFTYPLDIDSFIKRAISLDFVLIDHLLGGTNGANVAKELMFYGMKGKIILISNIYDDKYTDFSSYVNKDEIIKDPRVIFNHQSDDITTAIEISVLRQKNVIKDKRRELL